MKSSNLVNSQNSSLNSQKPSKPLKGLNLSYLEALWGQASHIGCDGAVCIGLLSTMLNTTSEALELGCSVKITPALTTEI